MATTFHEPAVLSATAVVLISPDSGRRQALAALLGGMRVTISREYAVYPSSKAVLTLCELDCQSVIVDLDSDPDRALELIEELCLLNPSANITACSSRSGPELLQQVMRAGARELLAQPVAPQLLLQALARASNRRQRQRQITSLGKTFIFAGASGGGGVTMLASNFGVALSSLNRGAAAIVDLDIQLGEVALTLGLTPAFSIADALKTPHRLDTEFLATLMVRHQSGAEVLAAPEEYNGCHLNHGAIDKLLGVLRTKYAFVVLDAGTISGAFDDALLAEADTLYLVIELSISSLRNARRILSYIRRGKVVPRIEIVLNRYDAKGLELGPGDAATALGCPPNWKIPNEWGPAQKARNSGAALSLDRSAIMRTLIQMAKAACGDPAAAPETRRKRFYLF